MKRAKGPKGKADRLFSEIVRRSGFCENCCKTENLQCCHIISRTYVATRWDFRNAFCLCAGCHLYFTKWPLEFYKFVVDSGRLFSYYECVELIDTGFKPNILDVVQHLTELKQCLLP